ncbi:MAG TPA: hypothetical protein DCS43_01965, partial [Verrucomicrobia bacterium]|nr:hypothetical protein [Verrucomicrobiota bacterium]
MDTNGNSIPDDVEWQDFGSVDPNRRADDDSDHDGLVNSVELSIITNQYTTLGLRPSLNDRDSDDDHMLDGGEYIHGTDLITPQAFLRLFEGSVVTQDFESVSTGPVSGDDVAQWMCTPAGNAEIVSGGGMATTAALWVVPVNATSVVRRLVGADDASRIWEDYQIKYLSLPESDGFPSPMGRGIHVDKTGALFVCLDDGGSLQWTRALHPVRQENNGVVTWQQVPVTVSTGVWHRVTTYLDFDARKWFLWFDGVRVGKDMPFTDAMSYYTHFDIVALPGCSLVVDDVVLASLPGTSAVYVPAGLDTDGDGIPDYWEHTYGFDSEDYYDHDGDFDGDGLVNFNEWAWRTQPNIQDSDADRMGDGAEVWYGFDPAVLEPHKILPMASDFTNGVVVPLNSTPTIGGWCRVGVTNETLTVAEYSSLHVGIEIIAPGLQSGLAYTLAGRKPDGSLINEVWEEFDAVLPVVSLADSNAVAAVNAFAGDSACLFFDETNRIRTVSAGQLPATWPSYARPDLSPGEPVHVTIVRRYVAASNSPCTYRLALNGLWLDDQRNLAIYRAPDCIPLREYSEFRFFAGTNAWLFNVQVVTNQSELNVEILEDVNRDGIPDWWELVPDGDEDADGLRNLTERVAERNHSWIFNSLNWISNPDRDADRMGDGAEVWHGFDPIVPEPHKVLPMASVFTNGVVVPLNATPTTGSWYRVGVTNETLAAVAFSQTHVGLAINAPAWQSGVAYPLAGRKADGSLINEVWEEFDAVLPVVSLADSNAVAALEAFAGDSACLFFDEDREIRSVSAGQPPANWPSYPTPDLLPGALVHVTIERRYPTNPNALCTYRLAFNGLWYGNLSTMENYRKPDEIALHEYSEFRFFTGTNAWLFNVQVVTNVSMLKVAVTNDLDLDGMPDWWENANNLTDAEGDPDSDGLENFQEYLYGTNPYNPDSDGDGLLDGASGLLRLIDVSYETQIFYDADGDGYIDGEQTIGTSPSSADTDGDGMPDGWELWYGLNPLDAADANADPDGDGLSNLDEYNYTYGAGGVRTSLNPMNPDSDGDGLTDGTSSNVPLHVLDSSADSNTWALGEASLGTHALAVDTDADGLVDGYDGVVPVSVYRRGIDANGNGYVDGELDIGSSPLTADSDGDGFDDGWEHLHGFNPT